MTSSTLAALTLRRVSTPACQASPWSAVRAMRVWSYRPRSLEPAHQPAQETVHEAELKQVALLVVAGEKEVVEAGHGEHAGQQIARSRSRPVTRGEVHVRPVREKHVLHPEGGPAGGPDPAYEPPKALGPSVAQVRQDGRPAGAASSAEPGRAECGGLLGGDHPVAAPGEHVEDRARVPLPVRRAPRPRPAGVEDERHGLRGGVVDGVGVAKPGRAGGQLGEVGIAHRVDAPRSSSSESPGSSSRIRRMACGRRRLGRPRGPGLRLRRAHGFGGARAAGAQREGSAGQEQDRQQSAEDAHASGLRPSADMLWPFDPPVATS